MLAAGPAGKAQTEGVQRRLTNLLLLGLVVGLVASGLLGWVLPVAAAAPLYVLHRALGVALLLALLWKAGIARRSLLRRLPRRDSSIALGAGSGVLLAASVVLGFAWTLGLVSFDTFRGYSALNVHVFMGLGLLPLMAWHLVRRWERGPALGRLLTRRAALRALTLSAITLAVLPALDRIAQGSGLRRLTGSKHAGSFTANAMPITTWTFDSVPEIARDAWRLRVGDASFAYRDLAAFARREVIAVLDCTGGWWSEQRWTGVRVGDLLDAAAARGREATVVSATGHRWTFPLDEVREALLATHLGGEPLSAPHGAPARLVAPGRRGFQWIKWVERIELG